MRMYTPLIGCTRKGILFHEHSCASVPPLQLSTLAVHVVWTCASPGLVMLNVVQLIRIGTYACA